MVTRLLLRTLKACAAPALPVLSTPCQRVYYQYAAWAMGYA